MFKLMIVDDSNIIRKRIQRIYNADEFLLVATASNGAKAIESFSVYRPQVVTMDITMPEIDGIECIKAITELDENVRILVVSALSDKATGIKALSYGANGFLCKPFTDDELNEALNELVEDLK